jgi:hypothetical protein
MMSAILCIQGTGYNKSEASKDKVVETPKKSKKRLVQLQNSGELNSLTVECLKRYRDALFDNLQAIVANITDDTHKVKTNPVIAPKVKEKGIAKLKFEKYIAELEEKERKEMDMQFKANPTPPSSLEAK